MYRDRNGEDTDDSQQNFYSFAGNRVFIQSGNTKALLNPGSYSIKYDRNSGELYLKQEASTQTDETLVTSVLTEINGILNKFYDGVLKDTFINAGYKPKFGVLLEGPPGTGKSQTMSALMNNFVALGGVIINVSDYEVLDDHMLGKFLRKINTIQGKLPLMVNFEDIDRIENYQEVFLTSILDGEQSPTNTIFFATTNFQEEISDRLKRPGRFDFIYTIDGMTQEVRESYINKKLSDLKITLTVEKLQEIYDLTAKYNFSEIRTFIAYYGLFGFAPTVVADKLKSRIHDQSENDNSESDGDDDDIPDFDDVIDGLSRKTKNAIKSALRSK
jgi:hypothetical protein